jgi:uncharacterized protein YutE (UPF0331/DUF86 family)
MHDVLLRKLERLKEEVLYLRTNTAKLEKNLRISPEIKKIAERSVYLCAEIALDIADSVISMRGLPKPSTYSDSIYKLGEYNLLPKSFAKRFVYIAGLRNFLAHDYQVDNRNELLLFLRSGLPDMEKYIHHIEKL